MTTHVYGNGINSTSGANTITHFYDRAGIKAANRVNTFQQFASRREMPQKQGKTFKTSKWLHIYDRAPNSQEFASKGYLTARSADEVSASLASATLAEGAGAVNKRSIQKVTIETSLSRYGEMIDYTDEVDLFSEDHVQVRMREELAALANSRHEDLIMMDMLSTGTVMYSGTATSMATVGDGSDADGETDSQWKISYDLMRAATRKLTQNRAKKNTDMLTGSEKVDTRTVATSFYAIIPASVKADAEVLVRGSAANGVAQFAFVPAHEYGNAGDLAENEVGAMHEVRFIEAEGMAVYAGKGAVPPANYTGSLAVSNATDPASEDAGDRGRFDVFPILFPTKDSFATVGLKGRGKIQFHAVPPSKVDNTNPYGTKGFFSYNFFYAGLILQEEKMLKVLVAASA